MTPNPDTREVCPDGREFLSGSASDPSRDDPSCQRCGKPRKKHRRIVPMTEEHRTILAELRAERAERRVQELEKENGRLRECWESASQERLEARRDATAHAARVRARCTCRHAPEGMLGWDRDMIDRECPIHGHEALERT
jgi:hypothetical protein